MTKAIINKHSFFNWRFVDVVEIGKALKKLMDIVHNLSNQNHISKQYLGMKFFMIQVW